MPNLQINKNTLGFKKHRLLQVAVCCFALMAGLDAVAGYFEYSLGGSYSKSVYSQDSYSRVRRYGTSFGYNFTDFSQIEFSYQNSVTSNQVSTGETSRFNDQVSSVNWVQNLLPRDVPIQPFLRGGIGQLVRKATSVDTLGRSQQVNQNAVTGVIGAGLRINFTKFTALRLEGTSYLSEGKLRTWRDNLALQVGLSVLF